FAGGDLGFRAVRVAAMSGGRREMKQGLEGAFGFCADAGFNPMAEAHQRDDGGRFHEVEMARRAGEKSPRAVAEGRGAAQGYERIHVGTANFELTPCAAVEPRAAKDLDRQGEEE